MKDGAALTFELQPTGASNPISGWRDFNPHRRLLAAPPLARGIAKVGVAVAALLLTSCAGPTVLSTPNSCATLLPQEWKQGVAGAPLPDGDTVGDWISFGDAQTGKLDIANDRTKSSIGIIERCEARDAAAVKRATRRWWEIF